MDALSILCAHLHALMDIPIYIFDANCCQKGNIPEWLRPLKEDFLKKMVEENRHRLTDAPFLASYKNVYTLAVTPVKEGGWLLMGPVTASETAQHPVYIYQPQGVDDQSQIPNTPHIPYEKFISFVLVTAHLVTGRLFNTTDLISISDSFMPPPIPRRKYGANFP